MRRRAKKDALRQPFLLPRLLCLLLSNYNVCRPLRENLVVLLRVLLEMDPVLPVSFALFPLELRKSLARCSNLGEEIGVNRKILCYDEGERKNVRERERNGEEEKESAPNCEVATQSHDFGSTRTSSTGSRSTELSFMQCEQQRTLKLKSTSFARGLLQTFIVRKRSESV
jgi:hypothetical protein